MPLDLRFNHDPRIRKHRHVYRHITSPRGNNVPQNEEPFSTGLLNLRSCLYLGSISTCRHIRAPLIGGVCTYIVALCIQP